MKFNMDPILQDRSLAYATSPNFRLNYFFLRCRGTGPIFLRTVFKHEYTGFSLKLSKLMVQNFPQITVSKVKLIFRSLYCFFYSCTAHNVKMVVANISKKLWDWAQIRLKILLNHENVQFGTGPIFLNKMGLVP